jgi:hypothetical protein
MLILFLSTTMSHAGCDVASLQAAIDDAERAFADLDRATFEASSQEAGFTLACLDEPLTPVQCAGYHRLKALRAFLAGDHGGATLSFQAVVAVQPGYQLPPAMAPSGHPLHTDFHAAMQYPAGTNFSLAEPAEGWITVDGRRIGEAPAGRPFLFQRFDRSGVVLATAWIPVGSPVPDYRRAGESDGSTLPAPVTATSPVPAPLGEPIRKQGKAALRGIGIGLGAAALGMYGGSFASRNQYDGAVYDGDEQGIRRGHGTTNGLVIGSASVGTIAVTLFTVGLL